MKPRPLPQEAQRLCDVLSAPPRLVAHLRLVHDAAADLIEALCEKFPNMKFDRQAVLFGAATHDLGKVTQRDQEIGTNRMGLNFWSDT